MNHKLLWYSFLEYHCLLTNGCFCDYFACTLLCSVELVSHMGDKRCYLRFCLAICWYEKANRKIEETSGILRYQTQVFDVEC